MNQPPPLRTLLVDDERLARKRLRMLLEERGGVEIVGEAQTLDEARALAREHRPDLVLLDIELSPESGFDLIADLPASTAVVFVTAHDTFAIRAFDEAALDYLLKPVRPERLAASLERVAARRGAPPAEGVEKAEKPQAPEPPASGGASPLLIRDGRNWHQVDPETIFFIQGEGTYTRVDRADGPSLLVLRTLNLWMERLPSENFVRLSRSLVVNLDRLDRLQMLNRNKGSLYFRDRREPLQIGRVASGHLRKILQGGAPGGG